LPPPAGASSRPAIARATPAAAASAAASVARMSRPGGERDDDAGPARVRVARAAGPDRPAVQRVERPDPELVPASPPAPPAAQPTLLRRIADRFRAPAPAPRQPIAAAPAQRSPRAAVTRLVPMDLQTSAPEAPVSETPAVRGTNPERLARMLGTEVTHDEQGNATVSMPGYVPFSTAPRTVSRVDTTSESTAEPASTTPSEPVTTTTAPETPAVDMDAIADTVIGKLRRELLIEREQAGGPMDLI
jgi:hypothetical protein